MSDKELTEDRREWLHLCPACHQPFTEPKFLPCFHTVCAACIQLQQVEDQGQAQQTFVCPSCQKPAVLPAGGVSELQTNYYVRDAKVFKKMMCGTHEDERLRLYCLPCQEAICLCCTLTSHAHHAVSDLQQAAQQVRTRLATEAQEAEQAVQRARERLQATKEQRELQEHWRAEGAEEIHKRHAVLLTKLNQARDDALNALSTACGAAEEEACATIRQQDEDLNQLLQLQQQMQQDIRSQGSDSEVVTLAKALKSGLDRIFSENSPRFPAVSVPVLNQHVRDSRVLASVQQWFGLALAVPVEVAEVEMTVVSRFVDEMDPSLAVFSLSAIDCGSPGVLVSYERRAPSVLLTEEPAVLRFSQKTPSPCRMEYRGRLSCKRLDKNCYFNIKCPFSHPTTLNKSLTQHFKVVSTEACKAEVERIQVLSYKSLKFKNMPEFSLEVSLHRAVDVDSTGNIFIVVEEAIMGCDHRPMARKVLMFQRPESVSLRHGLLGRTLTTSVPSICTYRPPNASYNPADVCFYQMGSLQVLLVADEGGDAIHVVRVQREELVFQRYLTVKGQGQRFPRPTALGLDVEGRLWVACAGDCTILCLKPGSRQPGQASSP